MKHDGSSKALCHFLVTSCTQRTPYIHSIFILYNDIKIIKEQTNPHILNRNICSSVALSTTPLDR